MFPSVGVTVRCVGVCVGMGAVTRFRGEWCVCVCVCVCECVCR